MKTMSGIVDVMRNVLLQLMQDNLFREKYTEAGITQLTLLLAPFYSYISSISVKDNDQSHFLVRLSVAAKSHMSIVQNECDKIAARYDLIIRVV